MKPYFENNGIAIYFGDSREVLTQIDLPNRNELVLVTDPPYGMVNRFGDPRNRPDGNRTMEFEWDKGHETTDEISGVIDIVAPLVSSFHIFCGPEQFGLFAGVLRSHKLTPKPWAWVKKCPPPPLPGNWWPSAFELGMYGYRSGAYFGDTNKSRTNIYIGDTYRHGHRSKEKVDHPTQKWLPMIHYLVTSLVPENGTAIDTFAGSGTTLVACRMAGRKAIGIESCLLYTSPSPRDS